MLSRTEIDNLTADEKLEIIQKVWQSFVAQPDFLPITQEEKQLLFKRSRNHRLDPSSSLSEKEFNARLERRLKNKD